MDMGRRGRTWGGWCGHGEESDGEKGVDMGRRVRTWGGGCGHEEEGVG